MVNKAPVLSATATKATTTAAAATIPNLKESKGSPCTIQIHVYKNGEAGLLGNVPGFAVRHTGVQFRDSREYFFGGGTFAGTGVTAQTPKTPCKPWRYHKTIEAGTSRCTRAEFVQLLNTLRVQFSAASYDLLSKNCNHFSQALVQALGGKWPSHLNRAAGVGSALRSVATTAVNTISSEKKKTIRKWSAANAVTYRYENDYCLGASLDKTNVASLNVAGTRKQLLALFTNPKATPLACDDESCLIFLPFKASGVHVHRIMFVFDADAKLAASNALGVKLYKNQKQSMDFDACEATKPTQKLKLKLGSKHCQVLPMPGNTKRRRVMIDLKESVWRNTRHITMFVYSNQNDKPVTRLMHMSITGVDVA
jgi:hypothetical protein